MSLEQLTLPYKDDDQIAPGVIVQEVDLSFVVTPFRASRFVVQPGAETPEDQHIVSECWFVVSGTGKLWSGGTPVQLQSGNIVHFAPEQPHRVRADGTEPLVIYSVWW
jgi:mannose-6-phosphate isomerase-like protein (cupin superfamily)